MENQTNQKIERAERPDKALFSTMMGVFFILFSLPAFYWAFYSFQNYQISSEHAHYLSEKNDPYLTAKEREERESLIRVNRSSAARHRLEAVLSGAGGLILFGVALLLFRNAWRARKRKNYYRDIDPRAIPIPTEPIEVRYKKLYDALFGLIVLFFGALLLLILYQNFTNKFMTAADAIIRGLIFAVPILSLLSVICYLMIRAKRNAVRTFDASGITRGDGRHFAWNEFQGAVTQTAFNQRTQNKYVWRVELVFANGESAWLIPNRIKNATEIFDYVAHLPSASLKN